MKKLFALLIMLLSLFVVVGCAKDATLKFEKANVIVNVGEEFELKPVVENVDGEFTLSYTVDTEGVVEDKGNNKFKAVKAGQVTITGTVVDNEKATAQVKVTVKEVEHVHNFVDGKCECGEEEKVEANFDDELIEKGKLIVATSTDYAPYEFIDLTKEGQDKFVGADMTLARYVADKLGLELEIKSMNFDVVLTALDSDKADLAISGFTYSDSRAASYLFSESYFLEGEGDQIIVTTKENASKYTSLEDFNKPEIKIAAQAASVQKDLVVAQLPNANLIEITDLQNALTALEAGTYDAVAMSYNGASSAVAVKTTLQIVENVKFEQEDSNLYVLTAKNNEDLMTAVNEIIKEVYEQNLYGVWMEEAAELFADLGDNAGEIIPDEEVEFEDELIEKGKLIVATSTDYAPYEFIDLTKEGQDKFVGADMTLARYVADKLGLELEIKSMNFDVVLTALDSDKADLAISGFTYSDSRAASYLFSESYFLEGEGDQIIVTTKENASKYTSLEDFNKPEIKIAAQAASVQKDLVVAQLPNANLIEITDLQNALTALEAGTYDAVAMSYNGASSAVAVKTTLQIVENVKFEQEDSNLYVLTAKNNEDLMTAVNEVIKEVYEQNLYATWMQEAAELFADLGDNAGEIIPE